MPKFTAREKQTPMKVTLIRFAKHQPLPPGYRVEWWEQDEHYHWVLTDEVYSDLASDRWSCWRGAWDHYTSLNPGEVHGQA